MVTSPPPRSFGGPQITIAKAVFAAAKAIAATMVIVRFLRRIVNSLFIKDMDP
jgi:hypothetical protein